jgi:hypothetical protein
MLRLAALVVLGVVGVACTPPATPLTASKGSSMGTATEAKIAPSGGTLTAGALTVTFPSGVFAAETTVTATPITSTAPAHRGQAFRLTPEGTTFSQPVTLTFSYADSDLAGTSPEALLVAFQHSSGVWAVPGDVTVDTTARTLSVKTTHFSDWTMVAGAQLRPPSASVKTKGTVMLRARRCYTPASDPTAELVQLRLGYDCDVPDEDPVPLPVTTTDWAVNGKAGGSGSTGTVSGELSQGTFTAPDKKPSPDTVAVSARVDMPGFGKVLVVSNVTITDGAQRIQVIASYSKTGQSLAPFVTATVADSGFRFEMPFPIADGDYTVVNLSGGSASAVVDTRAGCVTPSLGGPWDELNATKVTLAGSFITVEGQRTAPSITMGAGEGNCAMMTTSVPAATSPNGLQVGVPNAFFTSTTPPAAPLVVIEGDWTWTYTTLQ